MASYSDLRDQFTNDGLRNRVTFAVISYAQGLLENTPTLAQKKFALDVIQSPDSWGSKVLNLVLAANKDATISQIENASDELIQNSVDSVGSSLVDALEG